MGRMTAGPRALLFTPAFALLWACGPAGSVGDVSSPPEPLQLMAWAPSLGEPDQPVTQLFDSDAPLKLILASDFDQLNDDRSQESEDRPAQILINGPGGEPVEIPILVKTRGNFRLQKRICRDPPLRLNFAESPPNGTVFDGQDQLKLVTHCRDSDRYEQNVLEEYLTYRIYNQLTDLSFRVQLADITYLDTSGKNDPVERMGFLLEDEDALATRLGGLMVETPAANPDDFVADQLTLTFLFQFMVGNVDWGTGTSHNVKILRKDGGYYPIPYDFDWTGLVDAPYAGPNPMTEPFHDSVRERLYWGACMPGMDYQALLDRFKAKQDEIMGLVENQAGLSDRNRESAVGYLKEFFSIIESPREVERVIIRACRKW